MKIRNVEISAFRIYDDPSKATFDFTDKQGETASFVSLYAPNGFGKTSFYDAVEWGITKSINRFYIRNKELEKLANFQAQQNELPLIQNSKSERETYVKVVADTKSFEEKFKKHGNQVHDINFKSPIVHDFQQVILSQEWISAFLTESDGETRYKKFMEKPDLVTMNNYYCNLKLQIGVLSHEKNSIIESISDYEEKIINTTQKNLLTTINDQIKLLISRFNQKDLFQIELSTTKEELKHLRDIIANNQISNDEVSIYEELLKDITLVKTGNEEIIGINLFFEYKSIIENILKNISTVESYLDAFNEVDKRANTVNNLKQSITKLIEDKENCSEITTLFENYNLANNLINTKNAELLRLESQLSPLIQESEIITREKSKTKSELDSIIKQLDSTNNRISQLPTFKELINNNETTMASLETLITDEKSLQTNLEKEIQQLIVTINILNQTVNDLDGNIYPFPLEGDLEVHINLNLIKEKNEILLIEKARLGELDKQLDEQQELNSNIQKFIEWGLTIVNTRQASTCPLCEQTFNTYSELAEKISHNSALSISLQHLLSEQTSLVKKLTLLETEIESNKASLYKYYNSQIEEIENRKNLLQQRLNTLKIEITSKETELRSELAKLSEINVQLEGLNIQQYENSLHSKRSELDNLKSTLINKFNESQFKLNKLKESLNNLQGQINIISNEIEVLLIDKDYSKIINWFNVNIPNGPIDKNLIIEKNADIQKQLNDALEIKKQLEEDINKKHKELSVYTKDNLVLQQKDLQHKKNDIQQKVDSYNNFIKEKLKINTEFLDQESLSKEIDDLEHSCNLRLLKNKRLVQEYAKLNKYSENIATFLQSENARQELLKLRSQLEFLNNKVTQTLEDEKEKTKSYLQKKVQDFFYEKLINELYKKIDPHPEFKEVKFHADFESEHPRLDVFVKSKNDKRMLIPNLYFSKAQINILSLSIFLATALHSPKYDCIFIDDPIQSMDSINTLSTIDLLRSIVVKYNKQIILSTHDENFHNLLKKKMPQELFKSKFLELESFGKLKEA